MPSLKYNRPVVFASDLHREAQELVVLFEGALNASFFENFANRKTRMRLIDLAYQLSCCPVVSDFYKQKILSPLLKEKRNQNKIKDLLDKVTFPSRYQFIPVSGFDLFRIKHILSDFPDLRERWGREGERWVGMVQRDKEIDQLMDLTRFFCYSNERSKETRYYDVRRVIKEIVQDPKIYPKLKNGIGFLYKHTQRVSETDEQKLSKPIQISCSPKEWFFMNRLADGRPIKERSSSFQQDDPSLLSHLAMLKRNTGSDKGKMPSIKKKESLIDQLKKVSRKMSFRFNRNSFWNRGK